jgi:hypothetical protein
MALPKHFDAIAANHLQKLYPFSQPLTHKSAGLHVQPIQNSDELSRLSPRCKGNVEGDMIVNPTQSESDTALNAIASHLAPLGAKTNTRS